MWNRKKSTLTLLSMLLLLFTWWLHHIHSFTHCSSFVHSFRCQVLCWYVLVIRGSSSCRLVRRAWLRRYSEYECFSVCVSLYKHKSCGRPDCSLSPENMTQTVYKCVCVWHAWVFVCVCASLLDKAGWGTGSILWKLFWSICGSGLGRPVQLG